MIHEIGPHRFRHGDVTTSIAELMRNDKAQIMYSDPPWGQGNIKFWATLNKKMNGEINIPASLDDFLSAVFGHANKYVSHYLLIEYGVAWAEMIQERGVKAGFTPHGIVKLRYRAGAKMLPLDLHLFARNGATYPAGYKEPITDTYGFDTLKKAIGPLVPTLKQITPNPIILDPCCGMGYTGQAALDFGLTFRGNELNRTRLNKTLARFKK